MVNGLVSHWKKVQRAFLSAKSIILSVKHWTEIQLCSEHLRKSHCLLFCHMTPTTMSTTYWEREECLIQRWPSLCFQRLAKSMRSLLLGEPHNLIIWTLFFSSIIFHHFSDLTRLCVPPDSGFNFITPTLMQKTFHISRYLYVLCTYREYPSHMVLTYLIIQSIIPCKICFLFVCYTAIY